MLPKPRTSHLDLGQESTPEPEGTDDLLLGISSYSTVELIIIRDRALAEVARREPTTLDKLNMEQEMILQLHMLKAVQGQTMARDISAVSPQVLNAVTAALDKLSQRQIQVYSSERFKAVETVLLRVLRTLPEKVVTAFLDDYEAALSSLASD